MPRAATAAVLLLAALLLAVPAARADLVVLKNGGKLEGIVTDRGDSVEVQTKTGKLTVARADIEKIVAQKTPLDEFKDRFAALQAGEPEAYLELAEFARTSQLHDEMGEVLKKATETFPTHEIVVAKWREYQKSYLRLPMTAQDERALASRFGPNFRTVRTAHWILVYDVDDVTARGRVNTLEKVYQTFYVYFEKEKFELAIPTHPLEAILFKNEFDYKAIAPANSAGVYIHERNQLLLFDAHDPEVLAQTKKSQKIVAENIKYLKQVIRESTKPADVAKAEAELKKQRRLERQLVFQMRPFDTRGVFETTVHEAIHQLCFNSGLLPTGDIPTWLTEGWAVYFEKYEQWNGPIGTPGSVQADKVNEIRDGLEDGALVPLAELFSVGITKGLLPYGDRAGLAYAQSWAVIHYLLHGRGTQYRRAFFTYMKNLQARFKEGKLEKDLRGQFVADMGITLKDFEKSWIEYVRTLR